MSKEEGPIVLDAIEDTGLKVFRHIEKCCRAVVAFRLTPHIDQVWARPGFSSLINVWSVKTVYLEQCVW